MGIARFVELGVLIVFLQALTLASSEKPTECQPRFESDLLIFKVERNRTRLQPHRILGKVGFDDCTGRKRFPFLSEDKRFKMETDGVLKVGRRTVALHGRQRDFFVHVWDTRGRKWTIPVRVLHHYNHHHGDGHGHHHHGNGSHPMNNHSSEQEDHHHHHDGHQGKHHHGNGSHHMKNQSSEQEDHHHRDGHQGKHHHHGNGSHHMKNQSSEQEDHHHHHHDGHQGKHHHGNGSHHMKNHNSEQEDHHHRDGHQGKHHHHGNGSHHMKNQSSEQEDHHHHLDGHQGKHHHHHIPHHHHHPGTKVDAASKTEIGATPEVPVLYFPKGHPGLKRRKRAWVIPPINFPENDRGPYPKTMVQIRSDSDKEVTVVYSITGQGADQPPAGLFTVDRTSGQLYVTQPLDREKQAKYMLQAHAVVVNSGNAEEPMDIVVNVIDQNDNKPIFDQDTFTGEVAEASPTGFEVLKVHATDLDDPSTYNAQVRYSILSQSPELPFKGMFDINPVSGFIRVNSQGLDREKHPQYTLEVQAADGETGDGLTGRAKVILTVTDSNDNAPQFKPLSNFEATVPENQVGAQVVKMPVTDGDDPHTPAWAAKFSIVGGDAEGFFTVVTGPNKQEGIITTAKGLDFERTNKYTLLVAVENEVPFAVRLPTATATVIVNVEDVNEAPVFNPVEKLVVKKEDLEIGSDLVLYTATDPDTARTQIVSYKILNDLAGWLSVAKDTGMIKVKSEMDRESHFVVDNKYTALIGAYDNDDIPATGTGTLVIQLEDVNDNAPTIDARNIKVCNKESEPQLLSVTDKDGPGFAAPFSVTLQGLSNANWSAIMNDTKTGIILRLVTPLPKGVYTVVMGVADNMHLEQFSTVQAEVCDCTGADVVCLGGRAAGFGLPAILGILGAILLLLLLVLLLLMFLRRRGTEKKEPLLPDDDVRDNIYYYDEEGGGEDDQNYDLGVLHRGLDNRPDVFRADFAPTYMTAPQYRPRPANPEDIGDFIDDNLKAADNDPTAPPYDSLLVFDYEGGGSDAGSLSSLNSDSSGDQDYDRFSEWGPRFKKLADMYGGGEDDDMM